MTAGTRLNSTLTRLTSSRVSAVGFEHRRQVGLLARDAGVADRFAGQIGRPGDALLRRAPSRRSAGAGRARRSRRRARPGRGPAARRSGRRCRRYPGRRRPFAAPSSDRAACRRRVRARPPRTRPAPGRGRSRRGWRSGTSRGRASPARRRRHRPAGEPARGRRPPMAAAAATKRRRRTAAAWQRRRGGANGMERTGASLRGHYPDQVRRSAAVPLAGGHPLSPAPRAPVTTLFGCRGRIVVRAMAPLSRRAGTIVGAHGDAPGRRPSRRSRVPR